MLKSIIVPGIMEVPFRGLLSRMVGKIEFMVKVKPVFNVKPSKSNANISNIYPPSDKEFVLILYG